MCVCVGGVGGGVGGWGGGWGGGVGGVGVGVGVGVGGGGVGGGVLTRKVLCDFKRWWAILIYDYVQIICFQYIK